MAVNVAISLIMSNQRENTKTHGRKKMSTNEASVTSSMNYKGVFDQSIYEQNSILNQIQDYFSKKADGEDVIFVFGSRGSSNYFHSKCPTIEIIQSGIYWLGSSYKSYRKDEVKEIILKIVDISGRLKEIELTKNDFSFKELFDIGKSGSETQTKKELPYFFSGINFTTKVFLDWAHPLMRLITSKGHISSIKQDFHVLNGEDELQNNKKPLSAPAMVLVEETLSSHFMREVLQSKTGIDKRKVLQLILSYYGRFKHKPNQHVQSTLAEGTTKKKNNEEQVVISEKFYAIINTKNGVKKIPVQADYDLTHLSHFFHDNQAKEIFKLPSNNELFIWLRRMSGHVFTLDYIFQTFGDVAKEQFIKHFETQKLNRLHHVIIRNAEGRIRTLEDIIQSNTRGVWLNMLKGLPIIGSIIDNSLKEGETVGIDHAKEELFLLGFQIALLRDGISKEPIKELEETYVLEKRKIISPEIKDQIEKALLIAREDRTYFDLITRFIGNALAMPSLPLVLDKKTFISKVENNKFFKNYNINVKERLKLIVAKLVTDSHQDENATTSNRTLYYFHGEPGTGKSVSARELAEILDLPYFILPIRQKEDLSAGNLEGIERTFMTHNPGLLARALMSKNSKGKSYLNAILIIDDFDRILFDSKPESGESSALSFLLDYLDPEKRKYFSPYFAAHINISRLSIIITANKPIPKRTPEKIGNAKEDTYAALRSRVTELHFPNFNEDTLHNILDPIADDLIRKYEINVNANRKMDFIGEAIKRQKQFATDLEPRDLKRQLETVIIAAKYSVKLSSDQPVEISDMSGNGTVTHNLSRSAVTPSPAAPATSAGSSVAVETRGVLTQFTKERAKVTAVQYTPAAATTAVAAAPPDLH